MKHKQFSSFEEKGLSYLLPFTFYLTMEGMEGEEYFKCN